MGKPSKQSQWKILLWHSTNLKQVQLQVYDWVRLRETFGWKPKQENLIETWKIFGPCTELSAINVHSHHAWPYLWLLTCRSQRLWMCTLIYLLGWLPHRLAGWCGHSFRTPVALHPKRLNLCANGFGSPLTACIAMVGVDRPWSICCYKTCVLLVARGTT
jgi:hypothetical protein